jgi:putative tricarboxylic transport membrane protein
VTSGDVTGASAGGAPAHGTPSRSIGAVIVAIAAIALGIFVLQEAVTGANAQSYAFVGPGVFPVIIGAAQVLVGIALLVQAWQGSWRVLFAEAADAATPSPLAKVILIGLALVLDVVLMQPAGFVIASTVLFVAVARAFGSRRLLIDTLLGLVFTGVIHVVFARGLGLALPTGWLWESLAWTS